MAEKPLIYLSSGGTGGHMTPAAALAQELTARGFRVEVITDVRGLKYAPMFVGTPLYQVPAGVAGAGLSGKVKGVWNLLRGLLKAGWLIAKTKPAAVVGFGGYPSVPGVWAAQLLGVPTVVHEQNAIIGKANAFLADKAKTIAISLPQVQGLGEAEMQRISVTGNPVRPAIESLRNQPYPAFNNKNTMRIVVVGGSLGATVLSQIVPDALKALPAEYRARLSVLQQCRDSDLETAEALYKDSGIDVQLVTFIDDMAAALGEAHLLIARSGASTVAEATVAGRPAIFVPYPHHKDQQQKMNAQAIADQGGGWVMAESGFTVEALKTRLEIFFQNPEILSLAAQKAHACGQPHAAKTLAQCVEDVLKGEA